MKFSVRRRYSDFDWLRNLLLSRYPGMSVPPLPGKTMISSNSKEFVEIRRVGLQLFVKTLVLNVYFANDNAVLDFLSVQKPKEWAARKKAVAIQTTPCQAELLWRKVTLIRTMPNEERTVQVLNDAKRQINETDAIVKNVIANAKKVLKEAREAAATRSAMVDAITTFHEIEKTCGDAKKVEYVDNTFTKRYSRTQEDTADAFAQVVHLDNFQVKVDELLMIEPLKFYHADMMALKNMIDERFRAKEELERARRAHQQAKVALKRVETEGNANADKIRKAASNSQSAAEKEAECSTRLNLMTNSLMFSDFPKALMRRIDTIKSIVAMCTVTSRSISQQRANVWSTYLNAVTLSLAEEDEEERKRRSTTLKALESMEIADVTPPETPTRPKRKKGAMSSDVEETEGDGSSSLDASEKDEL